MLGNDDVALAGCNIGSKTLLDEHGKLPTLALSLVPLPCLTKVSYIARTLPKDISCRAGQVRVLFCWPDCRFLPNSLATGQVVMMHAGQVEIVAIVLPLIFGQSLLILCDYFTIFSRFASI